MPSKIEALHKDHLAPQNQITTYNQVSATLIQFLLTTHHHQSYSSSPSSLLSFFKLVLPLPFPQNQPKLSTFLLLPHLSQWKSKFDQKTRQEVTHFKSDKFGLNVRNGRTIL